MKDLPIRHTPITDGCLINITTTKKYMDVLYNTYRIILKLPYKRENLNGKYDANYRNKDTVLKTMIYHFLKILFFSGCLQ